jgi:hypothetical protein
VIFKSVPRDQRMIVERLGQFSRLCGPGWHAIIPLLERAVVIDPASLIQGWQGYSEQQLESKLVRAFYDQGAPGLSGTAPAPDAERQAAARLAREAAEAAAENSKAGRRPD